MTFEDTLRRIVAEEVQRTLDQHSPRLRPAEAPALPRYLTTEQAAAVASVTADTIRQWVADRRLPEHRAGRVLRVRLDELETFMAKKGRADDQPTDRDLDNQAAAMIRRIQ